MQAAEGTPVRSREARTLATAEVLATAGTPSTLTVWMPARAGVHASSGTNHNGDAGNCNDAKKARIGNSS
jgi:hypothetical protein